MAARAAVYKPHFGDEWSGEVDFVDIGKSI